MQYTSTEIIEQIRSATDIVHLISEYVLLKEKGKNFLGLCPFHQEKTPSFTVSPDKQIFHCFGCGAGGDVFSFIMQYEHLEFPEAVEFLAKKAGIEVQEENNSKLPKNNSKLQRLFDLHVLAAKFYAHLLSTDYGKEAKAYLTERGLDQEILQKFMLGYAPDSWNGFLKLLQSRGYTPAEAVQAGLVTPREKSNGYYDRFRSRIMYPIFDLRGRIIGFGGRVFKGGEPKYLNSPETKIFQKKFNLYGLKAALPAIRQTGKAILMEGYMDVITAHQYGFTNAVASLGTAFSREQAQLLARYAQEIIISYDSDQAGQQATLRSIEILEGIEAKIKVLEIPAGKDPDEYLHKKGAEEFAKLLQKAASVFEYKLQLGLSNYDTSTVDGKTQLVKALLPELIRTKNNIERQEYIKVIAAKLSLNEEAIYLELKKQYKMQKFGIKEDKKVNFRHNIDGSLYYNSAKFKPELTLLKIVLNQPELVFLIEKEIKQDFFSSPSFVRILQGIKEALLNSEVAPNLTAILEYIPEEEKKIVLALSTKDLNFINQQVIEDTIKTVKINGLKKVEAETRSKISMAEKEGNLDLVLELTLQLTSLQKEIQSLK
ncbi:DNA primase [Bacillota bacterium LX-D]|nr:DNA primase [Bacillota bacterium LX-D]